jgi:hypothetical protein
MYNVTLSRIRRAIVAEENQRVLHRISVCICSLWYSARNAHAPNHMWPVPLYSIFPLDLMNCKIFEKSSRVQNTCCDFLYKVCLKHSHSKKKWVRYNKNCILVVMWSTLHSCPALMKLEFTRHMFEKSSNTKFHENPFSESRDVSYRRTGRHDEATSRVSKFYECA